MNVSLPKGKQTFLKFASLLMGSRMGAQFFDKWGPFSRKTIPVESQLFMAVVHLEHALKLDKINQSHNISRKVDRSMDILSQSFIKAVLMIQYI